MAACTLIWRSHDVLAPAGCTAAAGRTLPYGAPGRAAHEPRRAVRLCRQRHTQRHGRSAPSGVDRAPANPTWTGAAGLSLPSNSHAMWRSACSTALCVDLPQCSSRSTRMWCGGHLWLVLPRSSLPLGCGTVSRWKSQVRSRLSCGVKLSLRTWWSGMGKEGRPLLKPQGALPAHAVWSSSEASCCPRWPR